MSSSKQLLFFVLVIVCWSCNKSNKYPYAIKDFRKDLRPFLIKTVESGIADYPYDNDLRRIATDEELVKLGRSEHPLLRAAAFRQMLQRKSFNHFDIIMEHLDDTATVPVFEGEFGIWYRTVSDYILQEAGWKTKEMLDKTVEEVLTKHNYLRSAYLILNKIAPQEKFYSFVKDMATRPRRLSDPEGYELGFDEIEFALYGLAKFRKKEDIPIIQSQLLKHVHDLGEISFQLMKEYPDTAYLKVLRQYHHHTFYQTLGTSLHGFTGSLNYRAEPRNFIDALAAQETDSSAKLFDTILYRLPYYHDRDTYGAAQDVNDAIWSHPCPAYASLRKKLKKKQTAYLKSIVTIPVDERPEIKVDTTKENYYWLQRYSF